MDPDATARANPTLLEITAPVRVEGESDAQTIFTWMVANRYLWMLEGDGADRVEDLVGTARLIRLAGRQLRFRREQPRHAAFELPAEVPDREFVLPAPDTLPRDAHRPRRRRQRLARDAGRTAVDRLTPSPVSRAATIEPPWPVSGRASAQPPRLVTQRTTSRS